MFLLKKLGFNQSNRDQNIFVTSVDIKSRIINIFIDYIIVIGMKRSGRIERVKQKLAISDKIVNIEPISFYISLKVERDY